MLAEAPKQTRPLHKVVNVSVFDNDGNAMLFQRSYEDRYWPGRFGGITEHRHKNESSPRAAVRGLWEELRANIDPARFVPVGERNVSLTSYPIDAVVGHYVLRLREDEVRDIQVNSSELVPGVFLRVPLGEVHTYSELTEIDSILFEAIKDCAHLLRV